MTKKFLFRLDDIAPNMDWSMMDKVEKLFNSYNVKPILGVIPKNEDKDLKKKAGVSLNPNTPIETILNNLNVLR